MLITYPGPHHAVRVLDLDGAVVAAGATIDVDETLAHRLLDQGWIPAADTPGADAPVDEVLAWVGADPARARQALAAEQQRPRPRKTLVGPLTELSDTHPADDVAGDDKEHI